MKKDIYPTPTEIKRWLTEVLQHTIRIEYYLGELGIGQSDIQRPHDMVGEGNKLEWTCIRGFALQYRGPEFFEDYVLPSLHHHRKQHHHLAWNVFNPGASAGFRDVPSGNNGLGGYHEALRGFQKRTA